MITYLIQSSLIWLFLYLIYSLFLSKQTFYAYNRIYLLTTMILGLSIPALINYLSHLGATQTIVTDLPTIYVGWMDLGHFEVEASAVERSSIGLPVLLTIYWIGFAIFLFRFLAGISGLLRLIFQSPSNSLGSTQLILTPKAQSAFSFFSWIFWNPKLTLDSKQGQYILAHEQAHARLHHSVDVLFIELLQIVFWFNPLILLLKRSIKNVHEYQADAEVLQEASVRPYGQLLLYQARYNDHSLLLVNHFLSSQIKKRIMMMTKKPSSRRSLWIYALSLPVLLFSAVLFLQSSTYAEESAINEPNQAALIGDPVTEPDVMPYLTSCADEASDKDRMRCTYKEIMTYLGKNLKYPKAAKDAGIEGKALISFVVDTDGNITKSKVLNDPGHGCGAEAMRHIQALPKWTPGQKDGKSVAVEMKIPVMFKLTDDNPKKQQQAQETFDQMPIFNGCAGLAGDELKKCSNVELIKFVGKNMRYPKSSIDAGSEGMVIASFMVNADGSVSDAKIAKSLDAGADQEVLRVLYSMPNWTPAQKDGKAVKAEMKLPVKFVLDQAEHMNKAPLKYDLKLADYQLSPNPNKGQVNIQFRGEAQPIAIRIFDLSGKLVFAAEEDTFTGFYQQEIDLSAKGAGTYFLQIRQGGKAFTDKIVVQ